MAVPRSSEEADGSCAAAEEDVLTDLPPEVGAGGRLFVAVI